MGLLLLVFLANGALASSTLPTQAPSTAPTTQAPTSDSNSTGGGGCCLARCCNPVNLYDQISCCPAGQRCSARECRDQSVFWSYVFYAVSAMIIVIFLARFLCRKGKQIKILDLSTRVSLLWSLTYPFVLLAQITIAASLYHKNFNYFRWFAGYLVLEFIAQNYLFFVLLIRCMKPRQIYKFVMKTRNYVSGCAVLYLWDWIPYWEIFKSDVSQYSSTWDHITTPNKYWDTFFVAGSTALYIINLRFYSNYSTTISTAWIKDTEIVKNVVLILLNLLFVLWSLGKMILKRHRGALFAHHKEKLREISDLTVENDDLTYEQAEDQFCIFFSSDDSTNKVEPQLWWLEELYFLNQPRDNKGARLTKAVYNKKHGTYEVFEIELEQSQQQQLGNRRASAIFGDKAKSVSYLADIDPDRLVMIVKSGLKDSGAKVTLGQGH